MAKIILICPEPIRTQIQGIGIRFIEMARHLATFHDVSIWTPNQDVAQHYDIATTPLPDQEGFNTIITTTDIIITHGHISEWYFNMLKTTQQSNQPWLIVDLYDPFLIENLQYTLELGTSIFYRDRDLLFAQLKYGDFFLTSSDIQRMFYIGILTGIGRLVPELYHNDPTLRSLIDTVPFGVTPITCQELNKMHHNIKGTIHGITHKDIVIFFGGVYDWYDPLLLINICDKLFKQISNLKIIFSINPNQETTPQGVFKSVMEIAKEHQWINKNIFFIPWFNYEKRFEYLKDVDIAICLHKPTIEMELSLRTRVLDYMNVGIATIATEGGEASHILKKADAGILIPYKDADSLYKAIINLITSEALRRKLGDNGKNWIQNNMRWEQTLKPLIDFCHTHQKRRTIQKELSLPLNKALLQHKTTKPSIAHVCQYWKTHGSRQTIKKILFHISQSL